MTLHEVGIIISVVQNRELKIVDTKELAQDQIHHEDSDISLTTVPKEGVSIVRNTPAKW